MSKILKRALKYSITPAILMVVGKLLGIILFSAIYGYTFEIGNEIDGIFSTQIFFNDPTVTLFINSFSNLTLLIVIAVPTFYFLIKTSIFQSTLDNPRTIVKITRFNILKWITNDDTSFLKIFIWCTFLWITSAIIVATTIQGNTYTWIGILAGVVALISALGSIKTFEVETNKVYPDNRRYY